MLDIRQPYFFTSTGALHLLHIIHLASLGKYFYMVPRFARDPFVQKVTRATCSIKNSPIMSYWFVGDGETQKEKSECGGQLLCKKQL